jgi:RHS repeat-associated protein
MNTHHQTQTRLTSHTLRVKLAAAIYAVLIIILLQGEVVFAQQSTGGASPLALSPGAPAGSYALSDFDNVNLFNGHLNFHLPLLTLGGRGSAGYTINLKLERQWTTKKQATANPNIFTWNPEEYLRDNIEPGYGPGVLYGYHSGFHQQTCAPMPDWVTAMETMTKLIFVTSDGTEYELVSKNGNGGVANTYSYKCDVSHPGFNRGKVFVTIDGTAATFIADADIYDERRMEVLSGIMPFYPSGYLLLRDGTRYRIQDGLVKWMRDRNSNQVVFEYNDSKIRKVIDSLGREVHIEVSTDPQCNGCDEITYKGFGGAARRIRVGYSSLGDALRMTRAGDPQTPTAWTYGQLFPSGSLNPNQPFNPRVVSFVELPDQNRRYRFYYNPYGELARIELPTGGAIEYNHGAGLENAPFASGAFEGAATGDGNAWHIYRRMEERRIYLYKEDATPESRTTFSKPEAYNQYGTGYVEVKQFAGNSMASITQQRHYFMGTAMPTFYQTPGYMPTDLLAGKEEKTETLNNNGALLRRVVHDWELSAVFGKGPYLAETVTTLMDISPHQVSKQSFAYDDFNNLTDTYDYDYGQNLPGPLLRRTHTEYLTTNSAQNGADYVAGTSYSSIHLRGLPREQWVSSDSAGNNRLSRSVYEYDNYAADATHAALLPRSNISGLCTVFSLTGQCTNYDPQSYQTRGNVTSVTSFTDAQTSAGPVMSATQFDVAGNAVKLMDARSIASNQFYATTIDYTDRFGVPDNEAQSNAAAPELGGKSSYAFPTRMTNTLGHISYTQYDFYLGKPVNTQDANGVVNSSSYNDALDRATRIVRAENIPALRQQTIFAYDDLSRTVTQTGDLRAFSDNLLKSQTVYDGLGRTVETHTFESANDYVTSRQEYDALGRIKRTFNPYRTTGDPTYGWRETTFDALGRAILVANFSNSQPMGEVNTSYLGNAVTVTDQAGRVRRSLTDALGRLVRVDEPNDQNSIGAIDNPTQPTSYLYDALGNLRRVEQGQQRRYFLYDSLSRLIRVRHPEQNTHPSLELSSDQFCDNNNQWSLRFTYDESGNLLTRTDARGTVVTSVYDVLDRVTSRSYAGGTAATTPTVTYTYDDVAVAYSIGYLTRVSSSVSVYKYTGFDALGRVISSQQLTDGQAYNMSYAYNLSGGMTSQTYPSGRVVKQHFDNAGRLSSVEGQQGGAAQKTYANSFGYAPHGAVERVRLGNGRWEHTSFNSRLQQQEIGIGASAADSGLLKLTYDYGTTNNNGNLLSQTIHVPTLNGVNGLTVTQNYSYDELNRLKTAQEQGGASWRQTYLFDRFGNRRFDAAQTTPAMLPANPTINLENNRLQGYVYDASGNVTQDTIGQTFAYDGESRQTSYNNGQATYFYDGDGRRVKKVSGAVTTLFVYNTFGQLIAEYAINGQQSTQGTSYLSADALGTPRLITDGAGAVRARHDYLPFGEEVGAGVGGRAPSQGYSQFDGMRNRFTGKERDDETGLDYFLARYYSSSLGRFTSPDPIFISDKQTFNAQLWNLYSYVGNNPLVCTDPTGMELVRLGQHTDAQIDARRKAIDEEKKAIRKDSSLSKAEQDAKRAELEAEKTTLGLEKEGNRIMSEQLASLEARGELNGLKLSDFTLSTESQTDFDSDPGMPDDPGAGSAMFFIDGYSTQIYINTKSNEYTGAKNGDPDYILYGGTAARHEQVHRDGDASGKKTEGAAYTLQLRILQSYGAAAFKRKEFYDTAIEHVTAGTKRKD